ncbi:hypothetical protein CDN99_05230 [Roseateles aquatilis]|uniref:AAA+ ATPase domain-containing protein n=1 Tax=Roseateles aquatilis TaxID=431061 RepID=A0A246JMH2_9BURK|nr:AAA family ATPase [Roseateles aquatilis]OWQ93838.1 hypothetical protein CDN99_05230 [Roseateles aquatilis]
MDWIATRRLGLGIACLVLLAGEAGAAAPPPDNKAPSPTQHAAPNPDQSPSRNPSLSPAQNAAQNPAQNPVQSAAPQSGKGGSPTPDQKAGVGPSSTSTEPIGAVQPSPNRSTAARGTVSDFVVKASIVDVAPIPLADGDIFAVSAEVFTSAPTSLRTLHAQLGVLVDGQPASAITLPSATTTSSDAYFVSSPSTNATSPQSGSFGKPATSDYSHVVTLQVRAPKGMAPRSGGTVTISLYSQADGRVIAVKALTTPVVGPVVQGPETPWYLRYLSQGIAGTSILVAMIALWSSRTRVREADRLEDAYKREREEDLLKRTEQELEIQAEMDAARRAMPSTASGERHAIADLAPTLPVLPRDVEDAATEGRLAVVLGSGVSAQAGLPTSHVLCERVLTALRRQRVLPAADAEMLRELLARSGPYLLNEALLTRLPRRQICQLLQQELTVGRADSALHDHLLRLGAQGVFIDLTWDDSAPRAFARAGARVFTLSDAEGLSSALRERQLCVFKPFGMASKPESLCLTLQELRRQLDRNPEYGRLLASFFSTHSALFLGSHLRSIEEFLKALPPLEASSKRQNVAVVAKELDEHLWELGTGASFGIKLASFVPTRDFSALPEVIGKLADAVSARARDRSAGFIQPVLRKVRLHNIGVFEDIEIDINEDWTVFLGMNGGGKSTILKAIALAMFGTDDRTARPAQRLLRKSANAGRVTLDFEKDSITTELIRTPDGVIVKGSPNSPLLLRRMLVLGFPVLRGVTLANPKGPRALAALEPSVNDVEPLLTGVTDSRLDDIKQWLLNIMVAAKDGVARDQKMLETVRKIVSAMLPGEGVALQDYDPQSFEVLVSTPAGPVEFDSLSQGMGSIFNWVGILVRRLYDIYPKSSHPEKEHALVLIDELDAHLHPEWQRRLVTLTKQEFPNAQIVATTHSALLVGALAPAEIRMVERDPESRRVLVRNPEINLTGQRVDEILTSALFAMDTTRNLEAENTINNYFRLYERQAFLSPEELAELAQWQEKFDRLNYGRPPARTVPPLVAPTGDPINDVMNRVLGRSGGRPASSGAADRPAADESRE